jgi:hypothetical protein
VDNMPDMVREMVTGEIYLTEFEVEGPDEEV